MSLYKLYYCHNVLDFFVLRLLFILRPCRRSWLLWPTPFHTFIPLYKSRHKSYRFGPQSCKRHFSVFQFIKFETPGTQKRLWWVDLTASRFRRLCILFGPTQSYFEISIRDYRLKVLKVQCFIRNNCRVGGY